MSRDDERAEKQRRRAERWYRSLTPEQRAEIAAVQADPWSFDWVCQLYHDGLIDENLNLTGAGELKLHQLELRKWMAEHPPESRRTHKKRSLDTSTASDETTDGERVEDAPSTQQG